MLEDLRTSGSAVGAGCIVNIICGVLGTVLGYALMPAIPDGGYYGALADIMWSLLLWCGSGLALGMIGGAFLAGRVARWVEARKK